MEAGDAIDSTLDNRTASVRADENGPHRSRGKPFRRPLSAVHGTYSVLMLVAAALILPPLALMAWTSVTPGDPLTLGGDVSFSAYQNLIVSDRLARVLRDTAIFSIGTVACSTLVGAALAWLVARTDTPFKRLVYACVFLQFAVPGMIEAIGWIFLAGARAGLITTILSNWFGISGLAIQSMSGMIFVQTLTLAPLMFLLLVGPFGTVDSSLEESAHVCGASKLVVYRRITVPILRPVVISSLILLIIRAIQSFETPLFLGRPAGIRVFTTEIYFELGSSFIPNYATAAAYGSVLLVILGAALLLYYQAIKSSSAFATVRGKGYRPQLIPLGRYRYLTGAAIVVFFSLYVAPVAAMVYRSLYSGFGEFRISTQSYQLLGAYPNLWSGLRNSVLIGVFSGLGAVAITCVAAWILVRTRIRGRQLLDQLISLPIVIPGTVLGLAFLITYLRVPLPIYGTIWVFVLAYVANYSPYAMRFTQPAFLQIGVELEESASVSGVRVLPTFRRIVVPLIIPALVGAWLFVFFHSFRDLSIAVFLSTSSTPVVATQLLGMWVDGQTSVLSAYGSLISIVSIVVGGIAFRYARSFGYRP